jgi:hypothetical protein
MDLFNAKSLKTQLFGIIPIHRVAVHVIEVTPEIARRIRDEWNFPNQRSIKVSNVDRLAVEMSYGWFVVGTPIFVCVMPDPLPRQRQSYVRSDHQQRRRHSADRD